MPTSQVVWRKKIPLRAGMTVRDVLVKSGFADHGFNPLASVCGIFSVPVQLDALVKAGDRVEIYRPLLLDPKEKRRQRVKG